MTKFSSLQALLAHPVDTIIDVRSPAEFAEDHVPGAINLPVLDNEERAEVGMIYIQVSPCRGHLAGLGAQVIDLEALANHRGSLLGARDTPQPSQKAFETALAVACARMDPSFPCIVEAESSKIGARTLPPSFWAARKTAPILEVTAPLSARAAYLARAYADILADTALLREKLSPLRHVRGTQTLEAWDALIAAGDKVALCRALAEDHYDPAYRRAQTAWSGVARQEIPLADLAPDTLADAARRVSGAAQRICTAPVPGTKRPTTAAP